MKDCHEVSIEVQLELSLLSMQQKLNLSCLLAACLLVISATADT